MPNNKENRNKSQFRVKLLADNNVVLIEADNYETEIFTPHIVDGRITFLNIIPNRRCCKIEAPSHTNSMGFVSKSINVKNNTSNQQNQFAKTKMLRYSNDQSALFMPPPLANSTPANIKQRISSGESYKQNVQGFTSHASSNNSTLATPEPVRRAVAERPYMLQKSMVNLPRDIKVARIYPTPNECTPKKVGRFIGSSLNSSRIFATPNISRLNSSLMDSPINSHNTTQNKISSSKSSSPAIIDSMTRWRKVLTPVRTYTRNSKQPVMLQRPVRVASVKKFNKSSKVVPTFLLNPTQGPNVSQFIEIKKRKLIKDAKICISPKTFKRQQKEFDYSQNKSNSLPLPLPRIYRNTWAMTAFDLLTNSNRSRCLSTKLNELFRKGCVNKASSTYSKYKILCNIPPLQQDEQVLEISHISLQTEKILKNRINA